MAFPVDEPRIHQVELAPGHELPAEFRARLLRNNGGEIEWDNDDWTLHPVWDSSDRKTIARTANHIVRETEQAWSWPRFPANGIALAANGAGDRIILLGDRDGVFAWNHATGTAFTCRDRLALR